MPGPGFVEAVNANGDKQFIPQRWLDHPVLGEGFRLPPSAAAKKTTAKRTAAKKTTGSKPGKAKASAEVDNQARLGGNKEE